MEELTQELADLALSLIAEFGADVSYIVQTDGSYDPATGSADTTEASGTFKALIEDLDKEKFNGNLVESGDRKLTAAASEFSVTPSNPDVVDFGEGKQTVIACKTTRLGATPIIYEIHVRN